MNEQFQIRRRELPDNHQHIDGFEPLLSRLLLQRGIHTADEISFTASNLLPYQSLKDIDKAVEIITDAINSKHKILIVGDYDADGATSSALLIRAFKMLGTEDVQYLVPNRFSDGYGLTPSLVEAAKELSPDLLITVDNGISSIRGVKDAKDAGMKVIVTDHHLPAESLPEADAIVNPNQPDDKFPSKHLAGVGVAFYLMMALRAHLRETGWFELNHMYEPNIAELLDLVALGTVADVVKLDNNNRILVQQGMARIRAGKACAGIKTLIEIAKRDEHQLITQDLGFSIAPRLNAAGRLDDMGLGIEILCSDDIHSARKQAIELDQLNYARREIEGGIRAEAVRIAEHMTQQLSEPPVGVTLYSGDWHEGVIGIVASRVKERLNRPVIVMTDNEDGDIRGSARSIKGFHIRDALHELSTLYPELLVRFGGHAMAAGLTIRKENLQLFKKGFDDVCRSLINEEALTQSYSSDGELQPEMVTVDSISEIKMAMPWGQGFESPQFDGEFELENFRWVGGDHLKMSLRWPHNGPVVDGIMFYASDSGYVPSNGNVEIVYQPDVNEWNGFRNIQLRIIAIRNVI